MSGVLQTGTCSGGGGGLGSGREIVEHAPPLLAQRGLGGEDALDEAAACRALRAEAAATPEHGHASIQITADTYLHAVPELDQRASDAIGRALAP